MEKTLADITMLHKCTKNHDRMIICFTVPEIPRMMDVVFIFHFGLFCQLTPFSVGCTIDGGTGGRTDGQKDKQTDRQTDRQTDIKRDKQEKETSKNF